MSKLDREREKELNARYTALCLAIGHHMVKHLLFDPQLLKWERELQACAAEMGKLQNKDNTPTKGTDDKK